MLNSNIETYELPRNGYIRQSQLIPAILPFSSATLWRKVKSGEFPKPIKLSERITAWSVADIKEWLESRHLNNGGKDASR